MKRLLALALSFTAIHAFAQGDERTRSNPNNVSAVASFPAGGFSFGIAYEHMYEASTGIGAHVRLFNEDKDRGIPGFMIVGAQLSYHFYKKNWDLSFAPSLNLVNIDAVAGGDDASSIAPGLAISLLTNLNQNLAIGFESSTYVVWFDDDYAGTSIDDIAVKVRYGF